MITISLKKFPTHLPYTKNKKAPDKFAKLNFQSIYNGSINRFARATLMENLHKYVFGRIKMKNPKLIYPVKIKYTFKTVINHGDISRRGGKIIWKYPKEQYVPGWDIENLANIWIKGGNDALVKAKVLKDDSIQYVSGTSHEYVEVSNFEDREIIIEIY